VADSDFKTIVGSVEFDPETRTVQGKEVLDISLRSTTGKKVRATLWPNLKAYFDKVEKGQLLGLKGKGTTNTVDGDNGPVTYNNLSVSDIVIIGAFDAGEKPERDNASTVADDDIPF
jgi:hypothetical protein